MRELFGCWLSVSMVILWTISEMENISSWFPFMVIQTILNYRFREQLLIPVRETGLQTDYI